MRTTKNGSVSHRGMVTEIDIKPQSENGCMSSIFSSSFETHSPSFDVYEFHWFTIRFKMVAVFLTLYHIYVCDIENKIFLT